MTMTDFMLISLSFSSIVFFITVLQALVKLQAAVDELKRDYK